MKVPPNARQGERGKKEENDGGSACNAVPHAMFMLNRLHLCISKIIFRLAKFTVVLILYDGHVYELTVSKDPIYIVMIMKEVNSKLGRLLY